MNEERLREMNDLAKRVANENQLAFFLAKPEVGSQLASAVLCGEHKKLIALLCSAMKENQDINRVLHTAVTVFDEVMEKKGKDEEGDCNDCEDKEKCKADVAAEKLGKLLAEIKGKSEEVNKVIMEL